MRILVGQRSQTGDRATAGSAPLTHEVELPVFCPAFIRGTCFAPGRTAATARKTMISRVDHPQCCRKCRLNYVTGTTVWLRTPVCPRMCVPCEPARYREPCDRDHTKQSAWQEPAGLFRPRPSLIRETHGRSAIPASLRSFQNVIAQGKPAHTATLTSGVHSNARARRGDRFESLGEIQPTAETGRGDRTRAEPQSRTGRTQRELGLTALASSLPRTSVRTSEASQRRT